MVVNPESVFSGGYFKVGRLTLYLTRRGDATHTR